MALTHPERCSAQEGGANRFDLRPGRASIRQRRKGACAIPLIMHAVRADSSLALRSASPHPALTRRPPRSAGRYPRRHHARRHRSALCSRECTKLTGAALIIATLNGATLNRTTRNGTTIDAVSLCRLWLTVSP